MLTRRARLAIAVLLISYGPPVSGLAQWPPAVAYLSGRIIDSITGEPIRRATVCEDRKTPGFSGNVGYCLEADSAGRFLYGVSELGEHQIQLSCVGLKPMQGSFLETLRITIANGDTAVRNLRTSSGGCDQRPFVVEHRVFDGFFRYGFEESIYMECSDSTPFKTWVQFSEAAARQTTPMWPHEGNDPYYPRFQVRWLATVVGPDHYGHLGVATHLMTVDSVIAIRHTRATDCGGAGPPPAS